MYTCTFSATLCGIEGLIVNVEADVSDGLPIFEMVGDLSKEVTEAKERVRTALRNSGYRLNSKRITVNLSPADIKKEGTAFDLSIAIAILASYGIVSKECLKDTLMIGELSLNGTIGRVNGVLPIVYSALKNNFKTCIVPNKNIVEGSVVEGIDVIGADTLSEVVDYLNGKNNLQAEFRDLRDCLENNKKYDVDFSEINGQEAVKRAVEVAVAGRHNILIIGPPGSGKTMMAKRIPTIMPDLDFLECMEISKIYSVLGLLEDDNSLILTRPFRAPHHTISPGGLAGGGIRPKPGEISLAHKGVLFLDELPEYKKSILEILRQPLEDKSVLIARNTESIKYPTDFMLVAAMNPCNCGYYPDRNKCNCSENQRKRYLNKISKPLLDRIDICTEAIQVTYRELDNNMKKESSCDIRKRIVKAQKIQSERYKNEEFKFNSGLTPKTIKKYCVIDNEGRKLLENAFEKMDLTARSYHKILKVARTISDLEENDNINIKNLSEAICYRDMDNKYWGDC